MKQCITTLYFCFACLCIFGQRKITTVKSYFRKDGTFVRSHTRHYNSGNGSSNGNYAYTSSSDTDVLEVFESDLGVSIVSNVEGYKKVGGLVVSPTSLVSDTNGVTILVAVLRYNDTTVLDVCPLPRSASTYDYQASYTPLYFKINKDRIKAEHIIELVSKYRFDLKDDFLMKADFLGIGKINLPKYMTLKIEAITLK